LSALAFIAANILKHLTETCRMPAGPYSQIAL
jgi:hypothetical protein